MLQIRAFVFNTDTQLLVSESQISLKDAYHNVDHNHYYVSLLILRDNTLKS